LEKHCETCTCDAASVIDHSRHHHQQQQQQEEQQQEPQLIEVHPCGAPIIENNTEDALLPPLPEPKFTYKRRVLPGTLVALDSIPGSRRLVETLTCNTAASYLPLTSHFINQSDPAYCGISTLLVVLNALSIDPMVRWRGGWRYYGHEDVLLHRCCFSSAHIQRHGLAVHELAQLARCHGAHVVMKRPIPIATTSAFGGDTSALSADSATTEDKNEQDDEEYFTLDDFRNDLISVLTTTANNNEDDTPNDNHKNTMLVVSFSRAALSQTGDGHYSPVAAYHAATDSVLILDVARFKYPPYWVAVADLYRAMQPRDVVTKKSRAWFLIAASAASSSSLSYSNKPATADDHGDDNAHQRQRRPRPVYDYIISSNGTNNTITQRTTYNTDPEGTIPAHLIPAVSGTSSSPTTTSCPFQAVKVEYCPAARGRSQESNAT
jgi:glutathione gamma-glutamylcysteinyltransferase